MNAALRRRHFRWWIFLLLVLPLLAFFGFAARPEPPSQAPPAFAAPAGAP